MKRKVELSTYCRIISLLSTAVICGVFMYALKQPDHEWPVMILSIVVAGLVLSTLLYMPLSISVDDKKLNIHRPLLTKSIPIVDRKSVV